MGNLITIGIDIGTTSIKAVAFNRNGIVVTENEVLYPLHTPQPGWAEQDPLVIEEAAISALRTLVQHIGASSHHIASIGISCAMHSLICIDEQGDPLSPLITWADGRATKEAKQLMNTSGAHIYHATGTPIHPMSPLTKLIWMKKNNYLPYTAATKFVSMKEFLLYRWFGVQYVDYAIASATGLFDLHTLSWNDEALQTAGITEEQLFEPVPPTTSFTGLRSDIAEQTGLSIHVPFVIGASDGFLANLGVGAINPGEVAITIGTSGAIRQIVSEPMIDPLQETFCYAFTDSLSLIGGPTNNGGIVLQWLKEMVAPDETYDSMNALAEAVPAGAEGLLFLPYLNGERAPMWNANMRGNIFGLSLRHKKEHLIRAAMEGVIFSVYHVGQALERLAGEPKTLLVSGGFARSPIWVQILADVFNRDVQVPISHQSSAWGAAWLALYAIGEVDSLASIKDHIPMQSHYTPNEKNHLTYMEMFPLYEELANTMNKHYFS